MIGSTQGTSATDIKAINQQIQDFKDGKTRITKDDLSSAISDNIKQGQEPSAALMSIYDSYDQVDKNHDGGIDCSELKTYQNSPKGMLSSLGITADSINQQINNLSLEYLGNAGNSSVFQQPSLLDTGLFDDSSSSSDSLFGYVDDSSVSELMQKYYSNNTKNGVDLSIIDALA